jgi:hypothetical protein
VTVGGPIGWFPLGPREVYVPAYRHTPRYLRVVNVQHVPNVAAVTIVQTPRYVNHHPDRSTWLPHDRFGRPEPVERGQRPPPSEWRQYIARPQPPANVPNTKRRQATEGAVRPLPAAVPAPSPAAPVDARPVVRPPTTVPRAAESPRPAETSRAIPAPRSPETPAAVSAPRALPATPAPAVRPEAPQGPGGLPAAGRDDRRMAPRAPSLSAPQPPTPAYAPPVARPAREATPQPAPRALPIPPPATQAAPARGRGEGTAPREGQRQAPHAPSMPAAGTPSVIAPPQPAAPGAAPSGGRDAGRAQPARPTPRTRPDGGEHRGGDRPGIGQESSR